MKIAFLFPGQGAQYVGMGEDLYEKYKEIQELYNLAQKEFYLLYKLLSTPNTVFSRQDLIEEIWGLESESDYRTVDVHIKRIREKLSDITQDVDSMLGTQVPYGEDSTYYDSIAKNLSNAAEIIGKSETKE